MFASEKSQGEARVGERGLAIQNRSPVPSLSKLGGHEGGEAHITGWKQRGG